MAKYYGIKKAARQRKHSQRRDYFDTPYDLNLTQEEFDDLPIEVQQYLQDLKLKQLTYDLRHSQSRNSKHLPTTEEELLKQIADQDKADRAPRGLGQLLLWPWVAVALIIGFICFWGACVLF